MVKIISDDLFAAIENRLAYWNSMAELEPETSTIKAYCRDMASEVKAILDAINTDADYLG